MPTFVRPAHYAPRLEELHNGQAKGDFLAYVNDGFVIDSGHWLAGRPDIVTVKPLPEASSQIEIVPWGWIMHTQGGYVKASNEAVWNWCNSGTGTDREVKSEPSVIGPQMADGKVIHCVPFNIKADSNYLGNAFYVWNGSRMILAGYASAETQDNGSATLSTTKWSLPQLNVSAGMITAYCAAYAVPCVAPATPTSRGIAHHSLHPAWSKAGHDCPRAARIHQMDWLRGEVAKRLGDYYNAIGEVCPA